MSETAAAGREHTRRYEAAVGLIFLDAAMTATIDNTWSSNVTADVLFALQTAFHWSLLLIGISATDEKHIGKFFRFLGIWALRTGLLVVVRFPRVAAFETSASFYDNEFLHFVLATFQLFSVAFYVALMRAIN